MKKNICTFLMFILLLGLVSCATFSKIRLFDGSEEDADYALHLALSTACERASEKLKTQLKDMNYLPDDYKFLYNYKKSIPGMETLLEDFTNYYSDFISANLDDFTEYAKELSAKITFIHPKDIVKSSNRSASKLFLSEFKSELSLKFMSFLSNAKLKTFNACINQYNSNVIISNLLNEQTIAKLEKVDISDYVGEIVLQRYFDILSSAEEMYRTTPDPFADEIAADVFGIN